jgi:hypothetical protein
MEEGRLLVGGAMGASDGRVLDSVYSVYEDGTLTKVHMFARLMARVSLVV